MDAHLRAGVAIFDEGRFHAAHDAWEDRWLALESGTHDERLLHGLIQYTAAVHHAVNGNESGAQGLAESAGEYLTGLPAEYRGINLEEVRPFLAEMADGPGDFTETNPPKLTYEGEELGYDDLDFDATAVAARVLAEEDGYDEEAVDGAITYAHKEIGEEGGGTFTGLVFSFVRETDRRGVVAQRLREHVERERGKNADVDGLFEE